MTILTTAALRKRAGIEVGDALPFYAWPGGYPFTYYVSDDTDYPNRHDGTLCAKCANDTEFGHTVFGCDIEEEDNDNTCDHCNCFLDNPTNDPEAEKERVTRWGLEDVEAMEAHRP